MTAATVQGWCPGALSPMLSGDGWIVRVRPPAGRLTPAQALAMADLAERCGNGFIQLTNRANLQLRGIRAEAVGPLVAGLTAAGLVDPALSPGAEARLNLLVDPFWMKAEGLWSHLDTPALWRLMRDALAAPDAPALPGKFGFAIDLGPRVRHLHNESADIRVETAWDDLIVRADGASSGRRVADVAAAAALAIGMARWFVASGGVGPDGRGRMRDHLARGAVLPEALSGDVPPSPPARREGLPALVTPAFGQIAATTLRRLALCVAGDLRVTPWRAFHLPQMSNPASLRRVGGLILDRDDPRLRAAACTGAPGCAQAQGATHALAERLAPGLGPGQTLHVSGCAKGCAHPGPASVTLVALAPGLYGLVLDGTAADPATPIPADVSLASLLRNPVPNALRL